MWFSDPGHVSSATFRPQAEKLLAALPRNRREAWIEAMEETHRDILGSGTVLDTKQYTGAYDHKYDSWDMPAELGIGISQVDDGQATVRLIQYRIAGLDAICQVVSYLNGSRLFHNVVVGEIVPAGSRSHYSPDGYARHLQEADAAYHALKEAFESSEGREGRYHSLLDLAAFLTEQARALAKPVSSRDASRPVPDWFTLSPREFELAVADLCREDGCTRVQETGRAGDLGADVIAYAPDGRKIVIQCKLYQGKVSSPDLQKFAGTVFSIHQADLALLVTTGGITGPAARYAKAMNIRLMDADQLDQWAAGSGQPPWV